VLSVKRIILDRRPSKTSTSFSFFKTIILVDRPSIYWRLSGAHFFISHTSAESDYLSQYLHAGRHPDDTIVKTNYEHCVTALTLQFAVDANVLRSLIQHA
jgi:hypothetical protein